MKPAVRKVPILVRFAFIALEIVVLWLAALYLYLGSAYYHPVLGLAVFWLNVILLVSSCLLHFFHRGLALSGFVVFLVNVLMGFSLPVF